VNAGTIFTLDQTVDEFRDYSAGFNYGAVPAAAVRVNLSHNTRRDSWSLTVEQERGGEGCWSVVLDRAATADEAAQLLALRMDNRHRKGGRLHTFHTMTEADRATVDASILLRGSVDLMRPEPTAADCWLLNAAMHVEGRSADVGIRASEHWPDATDATCPTCGARQDCTSDCAAAALVAALEHIRNEITLTDAELDATSTIQRKIETQRVHRGI
jgi:hypothetical protein